MTEDAGKLVLRLALGVLMLLHGLAKISSGVTGIAGMLQGAGLPAMLAYGVYVGEVIAPLLVIIGVYARIGAWLIASNMLFAIWLAHSAEIFLLGRGGGWALELQGMFLSTAVALALIGPGRYAVNRG